MSQVSEKHERRGAARWWFVPERESWLATHGYLSASGPRPHPDRVVFFTSPRRENARRHDGPEGQVLFDKRLRRRRMEHLLAVAFLRRRRSPLEHEWRMLRSLRNAGFRVPRPWAVGEVLRAGVAREGFLVTEDLGGTPLADALEWPGERAAVVAAVAHEVAALHRAAYTFPDLVAKHVRVFESPAGPRVGFLDLASATRGPPDPDARARDLAALATSLPRAGVGPLTRAHFLRTYLEHAPDDGEDWREAWQRVTRWATPRWGLRRHRWNLAPRSLEVVTEITSPDGWRIVQGEVVPALRTAPPGWSQEDDALRLGGDPARVREAWAQSKILAVFGVAAPRPVALNLDAPATALFRPLPPIVPLDAGPPELVGPGLTRCLLGLLAAGVLARGRLLDRLGWARGQVCVTHEAPLWRPVRVTPARARRAVRRLDRELAQQSRVLAGPVRAELARIGVDVARGRRTPG